MLCYYGCGQEAGFELKNGRHICSSSSNQCPVQKKKNSENSNNRYFKINASAIKSKCKFCNKEISSTSIKVHELNCFLNPENIKLCPVCNKPIKNFRKSNTCSYGCSNTFFRSGKDHPNWKEDIDCGYRKICFSVHKKECIICGEVKIVAVHHFDENKNNNNIDNLIPLCPTHHVYWHSGYKNEIEQKVIDYRNKFKSA
jgi:hypothetical protein